MGSGSKKLGAKWEGTDEETFNKRSVLSNRKEGVKASSGTHQSKNVSKNRERKRAGLGFLWTRTSRKEDHNKIPF